MRYVAVLLVICTALGVSRYDVSREPEREPLPEVRKDYKEVRVKSAPLRDAFELLRKTFGVQFLLRGEEETRQRKGKKEETYADRKVDFYFRGADGDEAVKVLCTTADVYCHKKDGIWIVEPFETLIIDKSVFFSYSVSGGSFGFGSTGQTAYTATAGTTSVTGVGPTAVAPTTGTTGVTGTGTLGTGTDSIFISEDVNNITNLIKEFLSKEGKVYFSPRGYVVVRDRPSRIEKIREIVEYENRKERPVRLRVRIVRIDYSDEYQTGIDWTAVLTGEWGKAELGVETSGLVQGSGGFFRISGDKFTSFMRFLEQFGKVNVVRSWEVKARSGIPYFFNTVTLIPYFEQSAVVGGNVAQTVSSTRYTEAGLKLKVVFSRKGDRVEGGIYTELSEFLKMEERKSGDLLLTAPWISMTNLYFPLSLRIGESQVLTGFKVTEETKRRIGVPLLSRIPVLDLLFGFKSAKDVTSELLIVLTVEEYEERAENDVGFITY